MCLCPEIVEILGRANGGVSVKPYICLLETGKRVYYKSYWASPEQLIAEWLGSNLAREMGLPVAGFSLARLPKSVILGGNYGELSEGIGFASWSQPSGWRDLKFSDLDDSLGADLGRLLVFDRWIQNSDRVVSSRGGNSNVLISPDRNEVSIIDHDNSFFEDERTSFVHHVGAPWKEFWREEAHQAQWLVEAKKAYRKIGEFYEKIPEEWQEKDLLQTMQKERVEEILLKPFVEGEKFWHNVIEE